MTKKGKRYLRVYRGTPMSTEEIRSYKKLVNVGLFTKCFMSTSLRKSRAMKFSVDDKNRPDFRPVILKVDVELNCMNQIGRDISAFSGHTEEQEWLLPYGSYV